MPVGKITFTHIAVDAEGNTEVMELLSRHYESAMKLMADWAVIKQHWERRVYGDGPREQLMMIIGEEVSPHPYSYAELYLVDEMTDTASVDHEYLRSIEKIDVDTLIKDKITKYNKLRKLPVFPLVPIPV